MTDPQALVAFLAARLDEDESVAKRAAECEKLRLIGADRGLAPGDWSWLADYGQPQPGDIALIDHQLRFDPARVLREVASKRRLLRLAHIDESRIEDKSNAENVADEVYSSLILEASAAVYSDHPDYQAEWKA